MATVFQQPLEGNISYRNAFQKSDFMVFELKTQATGDPEIMGGVLLSLGVQPGPEVGRFAVNIRYTSKPPGCCIMYGNEGACCVRSDIGLSINLDPALIASVNTEEEDTTCFLPCFREMCPCYTFSGGAIVIETTDKKTYRVPVISIDGKGHDFVWGDERLKHLESGNSGAKTARNVLMYLAALGRQTQGIRPVQKAGTGFDLQNMSLAGAVNAFMAFWRPKGNNSRDCESCMKDMSKACITGCVLSCQKSSESSCGVCHYRTYEYGCCTAECLKRTCEVQLRPCLCPPNVTDDPVIAYLFNAMG